MKHVISGAVVAAMLLLGTASVWAHEGMQEEATENTGQERLRHKHRCSETMG